MFCEALDLYLAVLYQYCGDSIGFLAMTLLYFLVTRFLYVMQFPNVLNPVGLALPVIQVAYGTSSVLPKCIMVLVCSQLSSLTYSTYFSKLHLSPI